MTEKRKTTRIQFVHPIRVWLKNGISTVGQIQNMSLKGAFAIGNDFLLVNPGDEIKFEIALSEEDAKLLVEGSASVIRKKANSGIGIQFQKLNADDLVKLKDVIDRNFKDAKKIDRELKALTESSS